MIKLAITFFMVGFLLISFKSYSQITLNEKNTPVEKVIAKIKKQSKFNLIYDENQLNGVTITVKVSNVSIEKALEACFQNLPITYAIIGNNITLKRKPTAERSTHYSPETAPTSTTVSGTIVDEQHKPLEGVSITVKGTKTATNTNSSGFFSLNLPTGNTTLVITSLGFARMEVLVHKAGNTLKVSVPNKGQQGFEITNQNLNEVQLKLQLQTVVADLESVDINTKATEKKQIGTVVDLKNRQHLNLAQVLEGTIPGLTLRNNTTTAKVISFTIPGYGTFTGVEELRNFFNQQKAEGNPMFDGIVSFEGLYALLASIISSGSGSSDLQMKNITQNNLVPELRGGNSFTGTSSGMLVVIDGIVQANFPANYPMNNVESVEVVKDPIELAKWGPQAAGGVILVRTKSPQAGKLQFDYVSNYTYTPQPNTSRSRFQLASSADLLAYYKEQYEKQLAPYIFTGQSLKPAQQLLQNLYQNGLDFSDPKFKVSWDSLALLDNRDQLRMLQQNAFSQSQMLSVSGGTKQYQFTLAGTYQNTEENNLNAKNTSLNLNLGNRFSLLKDKLEINWQVNTTNSKSQQGAASALNNTLDIYQLLVGPQGNYVYDYPAPSSAKIDQEMQKLGYLNTGANLLEDAKHTNNTAKSFNIGSLLNINYKFTKALTWSTSINYNRNTSNNSNLRELAHSEVRAIINRYAANDSNGVKFYVPQGGILNAGKDKASNWNARTGFSFNHAFNANNQINAAVGLAFVNSESHSLPNQTVYGYSSTNPLGLAILPEPTDGVRDFFGLSQYPSALIVPNFNTINYNRNLSLNAAINYLYREKYNASFQYASLYTPNVGFIPAYSGSKSYDGKFSWLVNKEAFFKNTTISTLSLSTNINRIELGQIPGVFNANVKAQPLWNNTAMEISGFTPSQINGQSINTIGAELHVGLWENRFQIKTRYNYLSDGTHQINGLAEYQISKEPWFNIPFISNLSIDAAITQFNSLQGQAISMGNNTPNMGGGFGLATNSSMGLLQPTTTNKEAHINLGLFKNRLKIDARYYNEISNGNLGTGFLPPDPSTGLSAQQSLGRLKNEGLELWIHAELIKSKNFTYEIRLNGAYNINKALDVPERPFSQSAEDLTLLRAGYPTESLWSYRWAGLDTLGNPQVYKDKSTLVPISSGYFDLNILDASSLVYSGPKKAPWTCGMIHDFTYKNFFVSTRLTFDLGHVMRTYIPIIGTTIDNHYLIAKRWQKPGDELHTDIAAMAYPNLTANLIVQNSSNSIVPADNVRLRELQIGYNFTPKVLKNIFIKTLTVSFQMLNVAHWSRNKLGLDPLSTGSNGRIIPTNLPKQYFLSINTSF